MEQSQQDALLKQWLKRRLLRRWFTLGGIVSTGVLIVTVLLGLMLLGSLGGPSEDASSGSGDGTTTDTSVDGAMFHAAWLKYDADGGLQAQEHGYTSRANT